MDYLEEVRCLGQLQPTEKELYITTHYQEREIKGLAAPKVLKRILKHKKGFET